MALRLSATVAVLVSTVGFVACGGDDDGGGVSKQDFARQANRVCNDVERELDSLSSADAKSAEDVAKLIDDVITKSREAVDRLKALPVPQGDAGQKAEDFVNTLEDELDERAIPALEDLKDAVKNGDRAAAAKAVQDVQKLDETRSDELAREAGATDCASG
jgi:hypothetical protein